MAEGDDLHVVLVPWSAFGHIMPFFQLSIALAKAGVHSSLISTCRNIQKLPILPPEVAGKVNLVGFRRPEMDSSLLPEDAEATVDISFEKIQYLKIAFDRLKEQFEEFIAKISPNYIISDLISPSWLPEAADKQNIPIITFAALSAAPCVFFGSPESLQNEKLRPSPESFTTKPPWVEFPSSVAYRKYEAKSMHPGTFEKDASGLPTSDRISSIISSSKAMAIRTCPEFEGEYVNLLAKITGKLLFPIGFLPPEKSSTVAVTITDNCWKKTFKWLDEQKGRTVVFVGFGSECKLSKDQIHLIAGGLELSGLPFLWTLRKPAWIENEEDVLPKGFTTRVAGRGEVRIGWAPQKEILAHPSIGGSFFHAGWGSIIETLQHGHCLVVLPFIIDQGLNARLLVEKGLAIEVKRNEEDGSFLEEDIALALKEAMESSDGDALRVKCREMSSIFGNSMLNEGYIECFVEYLKSGKVQ